MSATEIHTYLRDHLAGAAGAIALMQHVEHAYADSGVALLMTNVRRDVEQDRDTLVRIAAALGAHESTPRTLSGWLGEKFAELKLRLDGGKAGPLHLLEALEAIGMGIDGKLALWSALRTVAASRAALESDDFELLIQRARDQRARVESARLEAAREVFGTEVA
ncbi:MAG: hypothetical protein M3R65_01990 [Gemmatimonadota bacterium]|nr:hypothetical protein [Gemmatimonadota bacterium]